MVCPGCKSKTRVINSRLQRRTNNVWRRRQCTECSLIFTTEEKTEHRKGWIVEDSAGKLAPFSRDKLLLSLHTSCAHRTSAIEDAGALADTITRKLYDMVENGRLRSYAITQSVEVALNRFDKVAYTHYRANHPISQG